MPDVTKHAVLGTAGHIDHGKTELIKALTGVDTDRLKEEKERGISIELGFAELVLPSGSSIGVVDVPGHERFVRTMVSGVAGIDLILMVVAADEGVMPQTREHMDVINVLGISKGLVALTKTDLVEDEEIELAGEEVEELLDGTSLAGSPIVPVSSVTGDGIPEILEKLEEIVARIEERPSGGPARLPVDRVFTLEGHGTIVTGTLWSGRIKPGDKLEVLPQGVATRVRSVQVHEHGVEEAVAGQRTALGLHGISKNDISRGDTVGAAGGLHITDLLDARLKLVACARPLTNRTRIHFHLGTAEVLGRVILLEDKLLRPEEDTLVQMRLEAPVVAERDDLFVIRSYSPMVTIGGGRVLDPKPRPHKRMRDDVLDSIRTLEIGEAEEVVAQVVVLSGVEGLTEQALAAKLGASYMGALDDVLASGQVLRVSGRLIAASVAEELKSKIQTTLEEFAAGSPLAWGMSTEELRGRVARALDRDVLDHMLKSLGSGGKLSSKGDQVRWGSDEVALTEEQKSLAARIESEFLTGGSAPPSLDDVRTRLGGADFDAILRLLVSSGDLIKVTSVLVFHADVVKNIREKVLKHFEATPELTVSDFKTLVGVTRKHAIPILEHLDRTGVTMRAGNVRLKKR